MSQVLIESKKPLAWRTGLRIDYSGLLNKSLVCADSVNLVWEDPFTDATKKIDRTMCIRNILKTILKAEFPSDQIDVE